MSGRVTARVGRWRNAWWVFAQGPGIRNASGRKAKRVGPTPEDRATAERLAERLARSDDVAHRGQLSPLPADQALRDWFAALKVR